MVNNSKQHAESARGAIVALRKIGKLEFADIAVSLELPLSTPCRIYKEVQQRANDDSIKQLLAACRAKPRPGRSAKVADNTPLRARLRHEIIEYGDYRVEDAVADVLQEVGLNLCKNTILKICREHRDATHNYAIVRGVRTKKLPLEDEAMTLRRNYSNWLIDEYNLRFPNIVFVCYDETYKAIGGKNFRGGKKKISRPRGAEANHYALHEDPPKFSLMICAATSSDTTLAHKRPCIVWQADTDESHDSIFQRVEETNKKAKKSRTTQAADVRG